MRVRNILKLVTLASAFVASDYARADLCSRVKTFVDGSILNASDLNTEYNAIFDCANSLTNANLSASANIDPKKISSSIAGDGVTRNGTTGVLAVGVDDSTVEVSADAVRIKDLGVTTAKLAAGAVTTAKITDANVTTAKIADSNVTTAKIADANVTTAKIADSNVTTAKLNNLAVTTAKIADGAVTQAKRAAATFGYSSGSVSYTTTGFGYLDATNTSVTVTSTGRPMFVGLMPNGSSVGYVSVESDAAAGISISAALSIQRDGGVDFETALGFKHAANQVLSCTGAGCGGGTTAPFGPTFTAGDTAAAVYSLTDGLSRIAYYPCNAFNIVDSPSAGSRTYVARIGRVTGTGTAHIYLVNCKMYAVEL